jgi:hypothetical protein
MGGNRYHPRNVYIIIDVYKWYNEDVEVGDWITLAAVIVALSLGVGSIIHAQYLWNRERKERYKNEIIKWAKDIITWDIDKSYEAKKELKDSNEPMWIIFMQLSRLHDGYSEFERNGKLIILTYSYLLRFGRLNNSLNTLLDSLRKQTELIVIQENILMNLILEKSEILSNEFNIAQDTTIANIKLLKTYSEKVIEAATMIKI